MSSNRRVRQADCRAGDPAPNIGHVRNSCIGGAGLGKLWLRLEGQCAAPPAWPEAGR